MSQPDFDTMTDAELAAYQYSHREGPLGEESDLEDVEVEIAHPLSVSMSFRLPPEEASAIRAVAEQAGMSLCDWIRTVCTAAATADSALDDAPVPRQRVNIAKARRLLAELDKELNRAVEQVKHPTTTSTSCSGQSGREE